MARKRGSSPFPEPEEDKRPAGSVMFADPSKAEYPRHLNTFNEPYNPRATGDLEGIRSITGRLVPWPSRQYEPDPWESMNRKRGVVDHDRGEKD